MLGVLKVVPAVAISAGMLGKVGIMLEHGPTLSKSRAGSGGWLQKVARVRGGAHRVGSQFTV